MHAIARRGVEKLRAGAFRIPTVRPEADGTLEWAATTLVVAEAAAQGRTGLGYTYADAGAAGLINDLLAPAVESVDAMATGAAWTAMLRAVRNVGRSGIAACAISAADCALWDLKCRLMEIPLVTLLGDRRACVPAYASGGFTSETPEELRSQLADWAAQGFRMMKMKVGSRASEDVERVNFARECIGPEIELFVDANGAYSRMQALLLAQQFAAIGVTWFEEPVSSDDLAGLRGLRDRAPAGVEIAAGEYGYDCWYFRRMLEAGAVHVLQADATRCLGVTGFLQAADLAYAFQVPLSAHCAPALHAHLCCAAPGVRHLECFHDHVRIESMLFDGAPAAAGGALTPDRGRPGFGLDLRRQDADRYAV